MGRVNYNYKDRYLLTVSARYDGSSRLAPGHKWVLFPSAALAWRVKEESFLKDVDCLSNLKLRLGWGITGNTAIDPYKTQGSLEYGRYSYGSNGVLAFYQKEMPNPNLSWEKTEQWNAGIDFGFLNNRITGSLDYYYRETNDLISRIPVPAGSNLTNEIYTNVGRLRNEGIEFNIQAKVIDNKDFTWDLGMNVAWNSNKITKLNKSESADYYIPVGGIGGGTGNTVQAHKVGYPAYSLSLIHI